VVGTILHFDSLLAKLISEDEFPGWEKKMYKSVIKFSDRPDLWDKWGQIFCNKDLYNEQPGPEAAKKFFEDNRDDMLRGTEVLWPEKETYYDLMVMREQKGSFSFDSEKQNEPKDSSGWSIDMNKVVFWEDRYQSLEGLQSFLGTRKVVLGACDPSVGKSKRSDYSAIVTVYLDNTSKDIYVVDAGVGRWDVNTLVQIICTHHKTRRFTTFIYEANAAQAWLGEIIKKEPVAIPIKPVTNVLPKEARIMRLKVYIEQGKIKLSQRLTELNRELEQYPNGKHDDAIDALAMIIDIAEDFSQCDPKQMKKLLDKAIGSRKLPKGPILYGGERIYDSHSLFSIKKFT